MFIDYLTLMLVNMAAGLLILAFFLWRGLGSPGEKSWAAGFAVAGLVALLTGLHMTFAWPITRAGDHNLTWTNPTYGEPSVLLGAAFLGAALVVARGWSLVPVAIYGLVAGLGLSAAPLLTGIGFIATGLGGPLVLAVVLATGQRWTRALAAVVLVAVAGLWLFTAAMGYWGHLAMLSQ
jgi:putative membrane protein